MTIGLAVALLLGVAVLLGWVRLILWRRAGQRGPVWRFAALLVLQPVAAALLYLTLFPPLVGSAGATLVVATAGAPRLVPLAPGERLVALPEAGAVTGSGPAPDLATAIRRVPGVTGLRIVGGGLEARDREAVAGLSLSFAPPPMPRGLTALHLPPPTAPGAAFTVVAHMEGMAGATAALVDPAGRTVDRRAVPADGEVRLTGTARGPGATLFTLELRLGGTRLAVPVPVRTDVPKPLRLTLRAAAPGPEFKYLRRFAVDAGLAASAAIDLGGGFSQSDRSTGALDDALILDDRSWAAADRVRLAAQVRDGLGLVVRLTGPVPRGWSVLGLSASGSGASVPTSLPPTAPSDTALAARRGPGTRDAPASAMGDRASLPVLTRAAVTFGPGAVPLWRDGRGVPLAAWRQVGRGRVAVVALQDSFALVTSGHGDRHAELWSGLLATVARPVAATPIETDPLPRAGERLTVCGGPRTLAAADPAGRTVTLLRDPAAGGCAGTWPATPGWHRIADTPVYVFAADAIPAVRAAERREATLRLAGRGQGTARAVAPGIRGPAWPWFVAWLAAASALWWLERARIGRTPWGANR